MDTARFIFEKYEEGRVRLNYYTVLYSIIVLKTMIGYFKFLHSGRLKKFTVKPIAQISLQLGNLTVGLYLII